jgi:hypothetical protein
LKEAFLTNATTGSTGTFRSEKKLPVGKMIKIRVSMYGYENLEKQIKIEKTGDIGEFLLQNKKLAISGYVKDSITELPLQSVEVSFLEQSRRIQSGITNSKGYFDIETDFVYGQKITVRVSKKDYFEKEQTLTVTSEGHNILQDIYLPEVSARGLRAFINIIDKKTRKPLAGGNVRYLDTRQSTYKDTTLSANGKVELKLYQRPGTLLDLEISRPRYRTIKEKRTLSEAAIDNEFRYEMERERRSALGPVLLIGSGVSALAGGGMYLMSKKNYDSYKPFDNPNRETDFKNAQDQLNIAVIAGGVAAGALIGYIITRIDHRNKEKKIERKNRGVSYRVSTNAHAFTVNRSFEIVYQF